MWLWITLAGILLAQSQAQFQTECLQKFDTAFRKCFKDNGNFALETIFSLVTNGTSGPLPPGSNREQLRTSSCSSRQAINQCATQLTVPAQCNDQEQQMMDSTKQSMQRAIGAMCGEEIAPPRCLQAFDTNFRQCLSQNQIIPDNFFMLLSNQTLPPGVTRETVKTSACGPQKLQMVNQCTTGFMGQIQSQCNKQEQMMVGQTMQNMMRAYQQTCTGGLGPLPPQPPACLQTFESRMDQCAQTTIQEPMSNVLLLLSNQSLPLGKDPKALAKKLCLNWRNVENCGKNVVANAGCDQNSLLMVEGAFSNMMISIAFFCNDTQVPGPCILTLQNQFGKCYGEVGLDESKYFSNSSQQRGAIIGNNQQAADEYCAKRKPLYACMTKVMKSCQGAEQTLSLTGFDIDAMERAIGTLCADIPEYLEGLDCFQDSTEKAKTCMDAMANGITQLSAKQIIQSMSMDGFFVDFCDIRVKHVSCDAASWPSCEIKAVKLKTKFECQLLPNKCHDINEDEINKVCPFDAIPHETDKPVVGPVDECTKTIQTRLTGCMQGYSLDASLFVVNITHDRRLILGDKSEAERFCANHDEIYKCMRRTLRQCRGSAAVLKHWGHQQDALEKAVNVLCKDVKVYESGLSCLKSPGAQVQKCVQDTQTSMLQLSNKEETQRLSSTAYFQQFCSIRAKHLKCDLDAWGTQCDKAVVGLKTEFECSLIQDECKGAQGVSTICSESNYAVVERQKLTGGGSVVSTGSNAGGGTSQIAASIASTSFLTVLSAALSLL